MSAPAKPAIVIEPKRWEALHRVVAIVSVLGLFFGIPVLGLVAIHADWTDAMHPTGRPLEVGALLAFVVGCALAFRWADTGFVKLEVFEDRFEVRWLKWGPPTVVRWSEVAGYRDDRPEGVLIVTRSRYHPSVLAPTPSEAERVSLLAFLDGRGLTRMDA